MRPFISMRFANWKSAKARGSISRSRYPLYCRPLAREARFLSYRELADANGADWSQVRYAIGGHLWKLAEYGHLKERLLLSAIVVNKPNVETGEMDPDTLKGFVGAARARLPDY